MRHPYEDHEGTRLWDLIDAAIRDLENNSDLELRTDRRYVIGYLCKSVAEEGLLREDDGTLEPR